MMASKEHSDQNKTSVPALTCYGAKWGGTVSDSANNSHPER